MRTEAGGRLTSAIGGAFDYCLGSLPAAIRCDSRAVALDLVSVEGAIQRLLGLLEKHTSMGARSLERDLRLLEYPIARLRDFVECKQGALDRRGTEIMAEYLELRLGKIREEAEALDVALESELRRCA